MTSNKSMSSQPSAAIADNTRDRDPDRGLARRAKTGDHDAFTTLLRRHDASMRRVASRLLGSRTAMDDALQNAYLKAYKAMPTFREDARFGSWLYRIVANACLDELRRSRRAVNQVATSHDIASTTPGPERIVSAADMARLALATLTADQRATLVLVDGEGFDNQTAAEILGVAPGTVASRLSRARAALRHFIEEAEGD
jgi:RNA polymerase sigma-70 factor, ECF subfamily